RNAAAEHLTATHGPGHWSGIVSVAGALRGINSSRVLAAFDDGGGAQDAGRGAQGAGRRAQSAERGAQGAESAIVGTLRLATRKPWAIDLAYFVPAEHPLYLVDMAVTPGVQRRGIGRRLLEAAVRTAEGWKADAIRLDAYDHPAGAGPFYAKCGFTEVGRSAYRDVPLIYYELRLEGAS